MIKIKKKNQNEFTVTVEERGAKTEYRVTLDDDYWQYLTHSKISKEELIKTSSEFLLQRESKDSILPKFNLKVIKSYFPEFEEEMRIAVSE